MTHKKVYNSLLHLETLVLYNFGDEYCEPGHFNGPKMRNEKIFHFVFSGKGIFECMGKTYHLSANQGFFIEQNVPIYYKADDQDPWHYAWISLGGKQADTLFQKLCLNTETPIYNARPNADLYTAFRNCMHQHTTGTDNDMCAAVFSLFATLEKNSVNQIVEKQNFKQLYVQTAEQYILSNYHSPDIKIEKIAAIVGINRSYLTRLFIEKFGHSPQQYLLNLRMERAKNFLQNTSHSIQTIACSVGYSNIDAFSKIYKKYFGASPSQTRKLSSRSTETIR